MRPPNTKAMKEPLIPKVPDSGKKKNIFFAVFASILLIAAVIGIVVAVNSKTTRTQSPTTSNNIRASAAHAIVKSSCSITLHPDLCYSTLSSIPDLTKKVKTSKDVIELALNKTKARLQRNHFIIKKLMAMTNLMKSGKMALHVCLEMVAITLEDLEEVVGFLKTYPTKKGNRRHVDDIITYMSATITNQETCIDAFANDKHDRHLRESLIDVVINAQKMCSNSLALIKNMTDTDMADQVKANTLKLIKDSDDDCPEWLSAEDRRLLMSDTVTPNVVVDKNGGGDYKTVSAAVEAAPNKSSTRYVIKINAAKYKENVEVQSYKWKLMFVGDGQGKTVITGNLNAAEGIKTYYTATVGVKGKEFLARDITFENNAGIEGEQAVALRVGADKSAFYKCGMIGNQDTLYVHSKTQFYVKCYIAGTIDFIFGDAAVVLQECDIRARKPGEEQQNMITAQGRQEENQNTGIVIQKSTIDVPNSDKNFTFETYLGRPWKNFSRTVIMETEISDIIEPAGWARWSGAEKERDSTVYYAEYENTGPGADTSNRVTWPGYHVLKNAAEARPFTVKNFIDGCEWLGDTGFPFTPGLYN